MSLACQFVYLSGSGSVSRLIAFLDTEALAAS